MRRLLLLAVILTAAAAACAQDAYVFAYFKEPADTGIYFALSRDGYTFTSLNDGQPWIRPKKKGDIMRDVFITRNPDGKGRPKKQKRAKVAVFHFSQVCSQRGFLDDNPKNVETFWCQQFKGDIARPHCQGVFADGVWPDHANPVLVDGNSEPERICPDLA